ncbi:hypothetical protein ElyMa_004728900 [Elysia marginata]|uniref:Uncharacterized protein n=1 Tax=Elysia marginata TaxID=1093978 RepID=A0AAV4IFN4_9GAST|nr:hypothetical protein ElyMa_004728900 [Elysia marginata]
MSSLEKQLSSPGYSVVMDFSLRRIRVVSKRPRPRCPVGRIQHRRSLSRFERLPNRRGACRASSGSVTSSADERHSQSSGDTTEESRDHAGVIDWHLVLQRKVRDETHLSRSYDCSNAGLTELGAPSTCIDSEKSHQECCKKLHVNGETEVCGGQASQTDIAQQEPVPPGMPRDSSFIRCYGPGVGNHLYWDSSYPTDWDNVRCTDCTTTGNNQTVGSTTTGTGSRANGTVASVESDSDHMMRLACEKRENLNISFDHYCNRYFLSEQWDQSSLAFESSD